MNITAVYITVLAVLGAVATSSWGLGRYRSFKKKHRARSDGDSGQCDDDCKHNRLRDPQVEAVNAQKAKNEQRRAEKEHETAADRAARRMSLFTGVIALFSVVSAGVGVLQWRVIGGQLDEMQRAYGPIEKQAEAARSSADTARDTLVTTTRPWVSVAPVIVSDLVYDESGDARITLNFVLKNVGNSPAINVDIDAEIDVFFGDPRPYQKAVADRQQSGPGGPGYRGVTLFPQDSLTFAISLPISRASIDAFRRKLADDYRSPIGTKFIPQLVGCVDYKFAFAEGHHQTGFIFDLRHWHTDKPGAPAIFDLDEGGIPKDRLMLVPWTFSIPPT